MTTRTETLKNFFFDKGHHFVRRTPQSLGLDKLCQQFAKDGLPAETRAALMLKALLDNEQPVIFEGECIVATRTISDIPSYFTDEEWADIKSKHCLHERGTISNISPDYGYTIRVGLDARAAQVRERLLTADADGKTFLEAVLVSIEAVQNFIGKYEACAIEKGDKALADCLHNIKGGPATSFREALQLLRFIHFALWESGCYHNTLGRFDQYMWPYVKADMDKGLLTRDQAYELVLDFFVSCNKDSDLYPGMQQGDNGQSIVLGGKSIDGKNLFNELSKMCLEASYDINLIDPKINLRVDKDTPLEIYELGARLTKSGLGFPQYDNDDVVIPGLIRKGYKPEDAYNYVVAACWEFIIPGKGMDIPNIDALSFAKLVSDSVDHLDEFKDFEEYWKYIDSQIAGQCKLITGRHNNLYIAPAPFISMLMDGCIENAHDVSKGGIYNNYGIHGTGIATAADSLTAIKHLVFEEKSVSVKELRDALDKDFDGYDSLYQRLRFEEPKMGCDEKEPDELAIRLLDSFDKALAEVKNERGGIFRAGTGTAMYYIGHSCNLKATPDGRKAGEVIPANFSPSLFVRHKGPMSVIKSFTKPDLSKTINGGPLTIELDDSVFRNDENITKLAMLIRSYTKLGGHQLQLYSLNKEQLLDAKIHPENHRNLIVRVWGWSGYFVELDEVYQNHVINRIKFGIQ